MFGRGDVRGVVRQRELHRDVHEEAPVVVAAFKNVRKGGWDSKQLAAGRWAATVGYVAGCAARGIELEALTIETEGRLDLRGFLGLDEKIPPGYEELRYTVRIRGNGSAAEFEEVHRTVMATSPNYWNLSRPIRLKPRLVVE